MSTVDKLKKTLGVLEDRDLAKAFGVTKQAISNWRVNGVPAKIILKTQEMSGHALNLIVNGNSHIDNYHAAESSESYSPATAILIDIMKEWSEKKRRKLVKTAIEMNGDEEEGE